MSLLVLQLLILPLPNPQISSSFLQVLPRKSFAIDNAQRKPASILRHYISSELNEHSSLKKRKNPPLNA